MLDLVSLTDDRGGAAGPRLLARACANGSVIATALIGDPEVLILDEPANGLDPAGIRWMRDLLRGFANQGGTVLLSSHLLHEIEVIADDLVVIGNGRIVAQGTKSDLLARRRHRSSARPTATALAAALEADGVTSSYVGPDGPLRPGEADLVGPIAFTAGVPLIELRPADSSRPRGDVPRAHRRHPTRGSSSMTAIA